MTIRAFRAFGAAVLLALVPLLSAAAEPTVGSYTTISNKRISATVWEFVISARLNNTGPALTHVSASLRSTNPATTVVEGQLLFGDVPAGGSVASQDSFTVRHDRSKVYDESKLVWEVSARLALQADFSIAASGANGLGGLFAPATLRFTPAALPATGIERYEWDFNGDGVVDVVDTRGGAQTWTFAQPGDYKAVLKVSAANGQSVSKSLALRVAYPAPVVGNMRPQDGLLEAGSKPEIAAQYSDPAGIAAGSVRLLVNGEDVSARASISAQGVSYVPAQPLAPGPYTVYLDVGNQQGSASSTVWGFEVAAAKRYQLTIKSPQVDAATVLAPRLNVVVEVGSNTSSVKLVSLNDKAMQQRSQLEDGSAVYAAELDLLDGLNSLAVRADFEDGEVRQALTQVNYDAPPRVTITSPADQAVLRRALAASPGNLTGQVERPVLITGRLSRPAQSVTVNQQQAQLDGDGLGFRFNNFFLREGANLINAVATDAQGRVGTASINVSVDQTAPILQIESPRPGQLTRAAWVDVRGIVNDAVEAAFGAPEPEVFISLDGQAEQRAEVADRHFLLSQLALHGGLNRLTVRAVDALGNQRVKNLDLQRVDTGLAGLLMLDGHAQSGPAETELPKPLSVLALDKDGEPLKDQAVDFVVARGTGTLSAKQGEPASGNPNYRSRAITVKTDAEGRAAVWYTVGRQSGPAANLVRAEAAGIDGEGLLFSANSQRGAVARINADLGLNQISETGGR